MGTRYPSPASTDVRRETRNFTFFLYRRRRQVRRCPLLGEEQTQAGCYPTSADNPKRILFNDSCGQQIHIRPIIELTDR